MNYRAVIVAVVVLLLLIWVSYETHAIHQKAAEKNDWEDRCLIEKGVVVQGNDVAVCRKGGDVISVWRS